MTAQDLDKHCINLLDLDTEDEKVHFGLVQTIKIFFSP